jgi:hypothetical protein
MRLQRQRPTSKRSPIPGASPNSSLNLLAAKRRTDAWSNVSSILRASSTRPDIRRTVGPGRRASAPSRRPVEFGGENSIPALVHAANTRPGRRPSQFGNPSGIRLEPHRFPRNPSECHGIYSRRVPRQGVRMCRIGRKDQGPRGQARFRADCRTVVRACRRHRKIRNAIAAAGTDTRWSRLISGARQRSSVNKRSVFDRSALGGWRSWPAHFPWCRARARCASR